MRYKVVITKKAQKDLKSLDKVFLNKTKRALISLQNTPHIGKSLSGILKGYYSIRIWPYRIVYKVFLKEKTILVVRIGHRKDVYKSV